MHYRKKITIPKNHGNERNQRYIILNEKYYKDIYDNKKWENIKKLSYMHLYFKYITNLLVLCNSSQNISMHPNVS